MNKYMIAILVCISVSNHIDCVKFTDCGSDGGKVNTITVKDCSDGDSACPFHVGTSPSIDLQFTSNVDTSDVNVLFWGIIGGLEVSFPISPKSACGNYNIKCPVAKGSSNDLKLSVPVQSAYPKIKLDVKLALQDANGKNIVCQQFPAQIL